MWTILNILNKFVNSLNFENFVIFTINIFGKSVDVEDVPFQYSSAFSKNYTSTISRAIWKTTLFLKMSQFSNMNIIQLSVRRKIWLKKMSNFSKKIYKILFSPGQVGELPKIFRKWVAAEYFENPEASAAPQLKIPAPGQLWSKN